MKRKGRPKKTRRISKIPATVQFSPRGKPGRPDEVTLDLDHYEAIRLADFLGLDHNNSAANMNISRQTFGRLIKEARHKIAEAIIKGKIIRILD